MGEMPKTAETGRAGFPVRGSVVLVTGANRGIGEEFTRQLAERGAAKVYGGARNPDSITSSAVRPVQLDITNAAQVEHAARICDDITILVNNAGYFHPIPLIGASSEEEAHRAMETDFFGTLRMIRAFAPVLGSNGGGAIVNCLSVLSFINYAPWGAYSAAKSAAWSMTNSARDELESQGTRVVGVHASLIDTDMVKDIDLPKVPRATYVSAALDALEDGSLEALVDEHTHTFKAKLADNPNNRASLG